MQYPQIYTGGIAPWQNGMSAIVKRRVDGSLALGALGLEGDEQAEKKVHGGPDRALCHYPREHYRYWQLQFPQLAELFSPAAFGENLSTEGLTEQNVYIGDIFRWGETLIQVTQPRSPCYKLNAQFNIGNLSLLMQETGYCGWLYRVVGGGQVSGNQRLERVSRNSEVSVAEAIAIAFHAPFDRQLYRRLLSAAGLSASWSKTMQNRCLRGEIESFDPRLYGARPGGK
ncbi:6-N-hydroxylaminopurine resistance protein [Affinibrenneria salicis]|uniref:6-N-hydroxylaminopurine resistance protein n=1 Tax=Affinibrenneria salicis TaxID=2590031 RepID=A0A5J5FUX2_9GAMM|nr:6-hydroxyaminopurine reductase [Affinibrenneria salicis]KAA8997352.1 6-N-hydroxylaminopurine resistance protein [Affinibrenneria salicis]